VAFRLRSLFDDFRAPPGYTLFFIGHRAIMLRLCFLLLSLSPFKPLRWPQRWHYGRKLDQACADLELNRARPNLPKIDLSFGQPDSC